MQQLNAAQIGFQGPACDHSLKITMCKETARRRRPRSRCRHLSSATCARWWNRYGDLPIGAVVGTLLDPSDSFSAWYGKDGPQNYSFWDNTEFQALTARIDREIDPAEHLRLVHQAEAIMEQDPPL